MRFCHLHNHPDYGNSCSYIRLTTRKGAFTIISLEITNGAECVDVHVLKLPTCPDIIQAPASISQLAVTGALKRHLNVTCQIKASNKSI